MTGLEWVEQNFTKDELVAKASAVLCTEQENIPTEYGRDNCCEDCLGSCLECWKSKVAFGEKTATDWLNEQSKEFLIERLTSKLCPVEFGLETKYSTNQCNENEDYDCKKCWNSTLVSTPSLTETEQLQKGEE